MVIEPCIHPKPYELTLCVKYYREMLSPNADQKDNEDVYCPEYLD